MKLAVIRTIFLAATCVQAARLKRSRASIVGNLSVQSSTGCQSWCQSDRAKQEHRHCAPGDMAHLCGDCSYCSSGGKCESWCEPDRAKQEYRHCAPGDMAHLCGGCSYCGGGNADPVKPEPNPDPSKPGGAVTIVSYNLMSWCTQGNCRGGRMKVVANGIRKYRPAVLGTQEHGDGNAPYDSVRASLSPTGLTHRGAGTYYDPSVVEPVGKLEEIAIYKTYRYVSGQIYKQKACSGSCEFAFFNTHWDHGNHNSQANKVIDFMRRKSAGRPMVLTGDFNVWGSKSSIEHIKNSLGLIEASDPHAQTWCTGGKVDFILASRTGFTASGAVTDSNQCSTSCDGCSWKGSDHKLLKADLTLA